MFALGGGDRDRDGKLMLPRLPTPVERAALQRRRDELGRWLLGGPRDFARVKALVATMLQGFGSKASTQEESELVYAQYAYALGGLPTWAIERACNRFASGGVSARDVGADKLDLTWGPSSAMIAVVARNIVAPLHRELRAVGDVLGGAPATRSESPEERESGKAAVASMTEEARSRMAAAGLEREQDAQRRAAAAKERGRAQLEARRREYVDAGLPAPEGDLFSSLPLLLASGWRIEDDAGDRRVLVAPPVRAPLTARETRDNEMGS